MAFQVGERPLPFEAPVNPREFPGAHRARRSTLA